MSSTPTPPFQNPNMTFSHDQTRYTFSRVVKGTKVHIHVLDEENRPVIDRPLYGFEGELFRRLAQAQEEVRMLREHCSLIHNFARHTLVEAIDKAVDEFMKTAAFSGQRGRIERAAKEKSERAMDNPEQEQKHEREFTDITAPQEVEVSIKHDSKVIWVNVDGVCRLRCCAIGNLTVDDQRKPKEKEDKS